MKASALASASASASRSLSESLDLLELELELEELEEGELRLLAFWLLTMHRMALALSVAPCIFAIAGRFCDTLVAGEAFRFFVMMVGSAAFRVSAWTAAGSRYVGCMGLAEVAGFAASFAKG